jgi:hypothetical protein
MSAYYWSCIRRNLKKLKEMITYEFESSDQVEYTANIEYTATPSNPGTTIGDWHLGIYKRGGSDLVVSTIVSITSKPAIKPLVMPKALCSLALTLVDGLDE